MAVRHLFQRYMTRKSGVIVLFVCMFSYFIFFLLLFVELKILGLCETLFFCVAWFLDNFFVIFICRWCSEWRWVFPLFSVLTPYGHLPIIRALSSLRFISSGVLCFVFCVFFFFLVCLFSYFLFLYSHSVGGYYRRRLENFTFLILLFLLFF